MLGNQGDAGFRLSES